jgi:hypothetical protein
MTPHVRKWLARALLPPNAHLTRVRQTRTLERLEDGRWRAVLTITVFGREP